MKILIGTNNAGKYMEISEVLNPLNLDLLKPLEVEIHDDPEETGSTFEENAVKKARFYYDRSKIPTIADDSGIIIEALENELGVHTRRWGAGPKASDEEWIEHFLDRMKDEPNKNARFMCNLAYIDQDGALHTFEGRCKGVITESLEAEYLPGLPISACFRPEGFKNVFSALSIDEKNAVSHRGRAVWQLRNFLNDQL